MLLKRLFCEHNYILNRWHWCHGSTAMEPRQIEAEYICSKCGKVIYDHPDCGSNDEKLYIELCADKQIS